MVNWHKLSKPGGHVDNLSDDFCFDELEANLKIT